MGGEVGGQQGRVLDVHLPILLRHIHGAVVVAAYGNGAVPQDAVAVLGGEIHIPYLPVRRSGGEQLLQNPVQVLPGHVEAAHIVLGQGNGGDAAHHRLHGRPHGAGIGHVKAHVVAVVDAGEHHIGLPLQNGIQGGLHAVRRGAVQGIGGDVGDIHPPLFNPHPPGQGNPVGHGAALLRRGHHRHVSEIGSGLGQNGNALGIDAVVIGNQNIHRILL